MSQPLSKAQIQELNTDFIKRSAQELIQWGTEHYKDQLILACSFGPEDIVLLDMLARACAHPKVFYLDTELHFIETYQTRDRLAEKYNIAFIQVLPELSLEEQANEHGDQLWKRNPDVCCNLRKVEPLKKILQEHQAWITGIRREQSITRANAELIEWDSKFDLVKLNPLVFWTEKQVWSYIQEHDLPYNPLHDQNYPSIGCSVCTQPVLPGEDARSGRWNGTQKTECGLHLT